jgi:DNA-binding transcriptional ArsR family regulator
MTYAFVLSALADPTRRQIFETLRGSAHSVAEIAAQQVVSRPAVSQHLKVLESAGIVRAEAKGARRIYSIRREGLADLRTYVDSFWDEILIAFADEVENQMGDNDG